MLANDGTEMTGVAPADDGGGFVPVGQARSGANVINKKLSIAGLVLAVIALVAAIVVALTIIPQINDINNSNANAASNADDSDDEDTTTQIPFTTTQDNVMTTTQDILSTTDIPTTTSIPHTHENVTVYYPYTCDCVGNVSSQTYGIINAGTTYAVCGFYGWIYNPYVSTAVYPCRDIHMSVGDKLKFKVIDWTPDNVWLVDEYIYNTCDWSDLSNSVQLALPEEVYYDCSENQDECGYVFTLQDWHVNTYGNTLYFASSNDYKLLVPPLPVEYNATACEVGMKVKVIVEERETITIIEGDADDFDFANTDTIQDLEYAIGQLGRTLILQQFSDEQRIRSEGYSGLTNVRGLYDGDAAYDSGSYTNGYVAAIHDHSDNIIVVGIGEIQAVLNGVEFRTRHNDYNLNQPSSTSSLYNSVEAIEFPLVPPEVLALPNVNDQIIEMQEWFRAFKYQNKTHRNYPLYFKPILCYLEGTWILDDDSLSEPFSSDRHSLDANSWRELHDKIRFMSNSGRKNTLENLAHLPSSIRNLYNNTYPIISNWEYRILCHQLKNDISTSRFRINDDLSVQLMGSPKTRDELYFDRRTKFDLNRYINLNNINNDNIWSSGRKTWNYMDYLMEQIPGKNNYIANITDSLPDINDPETAIHYINNNILNAGYYSRFYGLTGTDAMGTTKHRRGWNDRYLFAAKTTQSKVSPVEYNDILSDTPISNRWSYAIPFEIIYQTPLSSWNPYNISFINRNNFEYNRIGLCGISPFNGWTIDRAYFTPSSFFEGITSSSSADTAKENICSLNNNGDEYSVYPSGHWITFPLIGNNVGKIRQRYPIFPIHEEGNTAYKEVKAFQDIILPDNYDDPVQNPDAFFGNNRDLIYGFELNLQGGGHQHVVYIPGWQISYFWYNINDDTWKMNNNSIVYVEGDERNGHSHTIELWRTQQQTNTTNSPWIYHIKRCGFGTWSDGGSDWINDKCPDNHDYLAR